MDIIRYKMKIVHFFLIIVRHFKKKKKQTNNSFVLDFLVFVLNNSLNEYL